MQFYLHNYIYCTAVCLYFLNFRYARNHLRTMINNLGRHARARTWKALKFEEFKTFLSVFFNMSIVKKLTISEYWNCLLPSQSSFWFRRAMSRNRFQNILKFLHVADFQRMVHRQVIDKS